MPKPVFALESIDHVVLRVRNLQPMLDFYCGALGCQVEKVQESIGLWQLRAGDALIDLLQIDKDRDDAPRPNMDHFCLRVRDYDEPAMRTWLAAHGVRMGTSASRYGAYGSGPSLYVFDPEGNKVELKAAAGG